MTTVAPVAVPVTDPSGNPVTGNDNVLYQNTVSKLKKSTIMYNSHKITVIGSFKYLDPKYFLLCKLKLFLFCRF